jgi:mRNA interferase RelE/StbE
VYNISISKQAKKYIAKQDAPTIRRLSAAISSLAINPTEIGEPLTNHETEYKIRVGDFRILYDVYKNELIVQVVKVLNRGDVYKK